MEPPYRRELLNEKTMARKNATSIHLEAAKSGAEEHNRREKKLDYVRQDLSPKNELWERRGFVSVDDSIAKIKALYESKEGVGKKWIETAKPIQEGVVVINDKTTMADLQNLAEAIEARFGIKTLQIAIHRDEGHIKSKDWKPNLHAHMLFDFTDSRGRKIKMGRYELMELQTMTAAALHMERGEHSTKKHLDAVSYKVNQQEARLEELKRKVSITERALGLIGESRADKELKALKEEFAKLQDENTKMAKQLDRYAKEVKRLTSDNRENTRTIQAQAKRIRELNSIIDKADEKLQQQDKLLHPEKYQEQKPEEQQRSRGMKI